MTTDSTQPRWPRVAVPQRTFALEFGPEPFVAVGRTDAEEEEFIDAIDRAVENLGVCSASPTAYGGRIDGEDGYGVSVYGELTDEQEAEVARTLLATYREFCCKYPDSMEARRTCHATGAT